MLDLVKSRTIIFNALAFAVGIVAYWLPIVPNPASCSAGTYTAYVQMLVLLLVGFAAGCFGLAPKRINAGGIGFAMGWLAHVLLSSIAPRTFSCSHQLLPFEAVLIAVQIVLPCWLGSFLGRKAVVTWQRPAGIAMFCLAGLLTAGLPWMLPLQLQRNESVALSTVREIGVGQWKYHSDNQDVGFACRFADFSKLPSEQNNRKPNEDHYWHDGYHYHLICYKDADGRAKQYALWATPFCVSNCGNLAYCLSGNGDVRVLARREGRNWSHACFDKGVLVSNIYRQPHD